MPTYDYECQKCGHEFEFFQSISEEPKKRCPKCRGKVNRLLGVGAGIIFKGSGFYATDYRSDNYNRDAKKKMWPQQTRRLRTKKTLQRKKKRRVHHER